MRLCLLEKIPPKTDYVPKFHLADVGLPAGVVDRCRVCDAGIPTEGWCFHCTNLGIGLHESHWATMIAAKPADEPAAEEAGTSAGAPAAHLLPGIAEAAWSTTHTTGFLETLSGFGATAGFTHVREFGLEAAAAAGVLGAQAAIASLSGPAQPAGPVGAALIDTETNAVRSEFHQTVSF